MGAESSRLTEQHLVSSIARAVGRCPVWTLGELGKRVAEDDAFGQLLGRVTVADLQALPCAPRRPANREQLDRLVLTAITNAWPECVRAGYVLEHVDVRRWELQASFQRLVNSGAIERQGVTSATRYCATRGPS